MRGLERAEEGYIKALEESGIGFDPWLVTAGNLQMEDGYACAYKLLSLENPPTAILAANNLMAIGVLKAARDKGLNVPGNLSVIGFDDSLLSKVVDPSLTVIKQPLKEIGEAAVNLLMNQLEGNQKHETIQLETRIVRRQSCGNPKERG